MKMLETIKMPQSYSKDHHSGRQIPQRSVGRQRKCERKKKGRRGLK